MENKTLINKVINDFLFKKKPIYASYNLEQNKYIKVRFEYDYNKETKTNKNIFIYLNTFYEIINLYKLIPDEFKHFYEIIEDECKFFIDLDAKFEEMNPFEWGKTILLIIPGYRLQSEDCKIVCNMFLNELKNKKLHNTLKIIDDKVYGKNRMLRIEGSTKINSERRKIFVYDDGSYKKFINIKIDGLITNLENTILLKINKDDILKNINKKTDYAFNNNNIGYILSKREKKNYNYKDNDVLYLKDNINEIINLVNSWYYEKLNVKMESHIFKVLKIENNRIDFKKITSYNCPICKRIHDGQNPYIFISNKNIMFNCRRSENIIKIG